MYIISITNENWICKKGYRTAQMRMRSVRNVFNKTTAGVNQQYHKYTYFIKCIVIKIEKCNYLSGDIDVSWMPYDLSNVKREIANENSKDLKEFKRKVSAAPKGSIMYSAIKHEMLKYVSSIYSFNH